MDKSFDNNSKKVFTRESIIGLGEASFRKNYYPELQEKIINLELLHARNKALFATIPDILLVSDQEGNIQSFFPQEDIDIPMKNEILENEDIMKLLIESVTDVYFNDLSLTREFQLLKEDKLYYFEARFSKAETDEILIIIRDMTERIQLERQLRDMAEHDSLTKLYNRNSFEKALDRYSEKAVDHVAIVSVDVNGLKLINDTLGHVAGDELIILSGKIITQVFEKYGLIARIGGDEFGVILEGTDEKKLEELLTRLNHMVESYNSTDKNYDLSLAYGYSYHKTGYVNTRLIFQEADNNMYQNKLLKKESIRNTFVKTMMTAMEAKDYVSEGHVSRMEKLALMIGEALSLRQDQTDRIILLTKFHDIGKIGIPDSILKKPDKLTEDEWKIMRTHSTIGERIALEAAEIRDIAHLILKHHEKWDGTGYPLGLTRENIPLECRVLAIVDTFDAMTNDRPYRRALSRSDAIQEITQCSGTQFDPALVAVFCDIINSYNDNN